MRLDRIRAVTHLSGNPMVSRILILVAFSAAFQLHAEEPSAALRVLTFNLRYINHGDTGTRTWFSRRDQVGDLIREDHPDIIGLQEAFRSMLDDVEARVPGYGEIGVGREDGKERGEYAAILYRKDRFHVTDSGTFWLSDTPEVPNSTSWKNRVTRICTWARFEDLATHTFINCYNTHLDHESQEAREKGVELILKHIQSRPAGEPYVLTGDFNAAEDNPAIALVKAGGLQPVDSWRQFAPDTPPAESGTMSQFTGVRDTAKIDYIFVPSGTTVSEAEIVHKNLDGVYPSDHYPVRATVVFTGFPTGKESSPKVGP